MIEIIPAIDIIDGKCVRLSQGDYDRKIIYNNNPSDAAKEYEAAGIKRLHLVDLDGAKAKHVVNHKVLESISNQTNLIVDFGGGIKTNEDIQTVFDCGASMVTIGSIAVSNRELFRSWLELFGAEKIILGADVKDRRIAISGWLNLTSIDLIDFLSDFLTMGVKYVLCTDISKDGMMQGSAIDMYNEINTRFPNIKLIASGGIANINEVDELDKLNIYGAILGKSIYEGKITLDQLKKFL